MDWAWIYGRVATVLGCLPSAIDDEPIVNIKDLLLYWSDQPPVHELLAAFVGFKSKRRQPVSEEDTRKGLMAASQFMGPARGMPPGVRKLIEMAEQVKRQHKGLIANG